MPEERIYITSIKEEDDCPFEEVCHGFPKLCKGCTVLPTRTEVIHMIAKALCADDVIREGYYEMAELVLNVMLGGK